MWRALPGHGFDPGPHRAAGPGWSADAEDDGQADGCPYVGRCARADAACADMFPPKRRFGRDFVRCRHA